MPSWPAPRPTWAAPSSRPSPDDPELTGGGCAGYRGRFAPSPTGWLHLGNARTALFAWARARAAGGKFVLRVEDLDTPRNRPEAVSGNLAELRWLGLDWDEGPDLGGPFAPYTQSERTSHYVSALTRLIEAGFVHECFLSRREVSELAAQVSESVADSEEPAVYGPAHRELNERVAPSRRLAGHPASLRFRVPEGSVSFTDGVQGALRIDLSSLGDFVVRRSDGQVAYQLAVVVDDAAMAMTEVARGADLVESTAAQLLLYEALDLMAPTFAHVGLLTDESGRKLSKRHGALALHEIAAAGASPSDVLGLLARSLGWELGDRRPTPDGVIAAAIVAGGRAPPGPSALTADEVATLAVPGPDGVGTLGVDS